MELKAQFQAPSLLFEEVDLPVGVPWGTKIYRRAKLRAEMVGDREAALDEMLADNPNLLEGEGEEAQVNIGGIEWAAKTRVRRIVSIAIEDGSDRLEGKPLRDALRNGLYPADGEALLEADKRLGEKLPGGSAASDPSGQQRQDSESSDTPAKK